MRVAAAAAAVAVVLALAGCGGRAAPVSAAPGRPIPEPKPPIAKPVAEAPPERPADLELDAVRIETPAFVPTLLDAYPAPAGSAAERAWPDVKAGRAPPAGLLDAVTAELPFEELYAFSWARFHAGEPASALDSLVRAIGKAPADDGLRRILFAEAAWLLPRLGLGAGHAVLVGHELLGPDRQAVRKLADGYAAAGDLIGAEQLYASLIAGALPVELAEVHFAIAMVMRRAGRWGQVVASLEQALDAADSAGAAGAAIRARTDAALRELAPTLGRAYAATWDDRLRVAARDSYQLLGDEHGRAVLAALVPTEQGAHDPTLIRQLIEGYAPAMASCFVPVRDARLRFVLEVTIAQGGRLAEVRARDAGALATCLEGRLGSLTFPMVRNGQPYIVRQRITLATRK